MGFLKSLFTGKVPTAEEQQQTDNQRKFDILKFDGVKALKMRQMQQAERCFTAALEIKDDPETHDYLSQVYINTAQLDLAMNELNILRNAEPDNEQLLMRIVQVAFMQEDYPQMEQLCRQALAMEQPNEMFKYMYARAKRGMNQPEEALHLLDEVIAENPNLLDVQLLKADTLLVLGRNDEALSHTQWLAERVPDNEDVLLLVAQAQKANNQTQEAIDTCSAIIDLNPFSATAYRERAALRQALGDEAGAADDLQQARDIMPESDAEDIEQQVNQAYRNANPFG